MTDAKRVEGHGQTVLVLQGGGALGAYQAGVYEALHEAGLEPDWVVGTSIGAINAALIAGNAPGVRLERLKAFWSRVSHGPFAQFVGQAPWFGPSFANAVTTAAGLGGFFAPNPFAAFALFAPTPGVVPAFYSTEPLRATLAALMDPALLAGGPMRLTVGAADVSSGEMRYFDSRRDALRLDHVLASGALPPAFPAVEIDGVAYWDGGILSNTPVETVFDDNPRRDSLIFAVHMWNPRGVAPDTIAKAIGREKDLRYASRAVSHIARQTQIHRLRHVIADLASRLPPEALASPEVAHLAAYGCLTKMHVVRLLAPPVQGEDHSKDIDFSPSGVAQRWRAGFDDARRMIERAPWRAPSDPMEGLVLHESASAAGLGSDAR